MQKNTKRNQGRFTVNYESKKFFSGSSNISSDRAPKKKTAERIVYFNNYKQMYSYEQQFSIPYVGSI